jgi:Flp pilus assembly protein TadD
MLRLSATCVLRQFNGAILVCLLALGPAMPGHSQEGEGANVIPPARTPAPGGAAGPAAEEPAAREPAPAAAVDEVADEEPEEGGIRGGLLMEARRAIRASRYDEALTKLQELRRQGQRQPAVHYWTGVAYERLGLLERSWRELHQAAVYQPDNRTYTNALRDVERRLTSGPASTPAGAEPPAASAAALAAAGPEELRVRAERALRQDRPRLAYGLARSALAEAPEPLEVTLLGVDAALRASAPAAARALFETRPESAAPELEGVRRRIAALEGTAPAAPAEGDTLQRARFALDALRLDEARELLEAARVQSPADPEVLRLMASWHALRGEERVAHAMVEEAALSDPTLRRYQERPRLLEVSPLANPHSTLLGAPVSAKPAQGAQP